jgi:hypothetical protein
MKGKIRIWVNSIQQPAWVSNTVKMQLTCLQAPEEEVSDNVLLFREARNKVTLTLCDAEYNDIA